jgi:hypothetical protein
MDGLDFVVRWRSLSLVLSLSLPRDPLLLAGSSAGL